MEIVNGNRKMKRGKWKEENAERKIEIGNGKMEIGLGFSVIWSQTSHFVTI